MTITTIEAFDLISALSRVCSGLTRTLTMEDMVDMLRELHAAGYVIVRAVDLQPPQAPSTETAPPVSDDDLPPWRYRIMWAADDDGVRRVRSIPDARYAVVAGKTFIEASDENDAQKLYANRVSIARLEEFTLDGVAVQFISTDEIPF